MPRSPYASVKRVVHSITIHPRVLEFLRAHPGQGSKMVEEAVVAHFGLDLGEDAPTFAGHVAAHAATRAAGLKVVDDDDDDSSAPERPAPAEGHPLSPAALRHYQRHGLPIPKGARIVTTEEVEAQAEAALKETLRIIQEGGEEEF